MMHGFNYPMRVGSEGDNPIEAKMHEHHIKENDLFIIASDGLWDNVYVP